MSSLATYSITRTVEKLWESSARDRNIIISVILKTIPKGSMSFLKKLYCFRMDDPKKCRQMSFFFLKKKLGNPYCTNGALVSRKHGWTVAA